MKNKRKKKQVKHAYRRAKERYNFDIKEHEYLVLVKQIQNQQAKFIQATSNRAKVFEVNLGDRKFRVVYDNIRKSIVTFLPEVDWWDKEEVNE